MEFIEVIHTRRSIRKYQDKEVSADLIQKLLAAAMQAPSTADARPWHFIVVTDPAIKNQMRDVHPYVKMVTESPVSILICADVKKEIFSDFWPQDCAAAMQNLLLAAHASGLGAVWTGIHPIDERVQKFKEICDLPENIIPFGLAVIGWPDQEVKSEERYDEGLVHSNVWQNC